MDISKEFWIVRLGLKKKTSFILLQLGQNFYTAICILLVNGAASIGNFIFSTDNFRKKNGKK